MSRPHSLRRYDVLRALQGGTFETIQSICDATGIHAPSQVYAHLNELEGEALISRTAGGAREIQLT